MRIVSFAQDALDRLMKKPPAPVSLAAAYSEAKASYERAIAERKEQMLVASAVLDVVDGEPSRGEAWRL